MPLATDGPRYHASLVDACDDEMRNGTYIRALECIRKCSEADDWFTVRILLPYMEKARTASQAGNFIEVCAIAKTLDVLLDNHEHGDIFGEYYEEGED